MVRARFAALGVAGGLLLLTSGCMNMRERFQSWRANGGFHQSTDCPCQEYGANGALGTSIETAGPVLVSPEASMPGMPAAPPPGTFQQPPMGPPPRIHPVPATTTPWSGTSRNK